MRLANDNYLYKSIKRQNTGLLLSEDSRRWIGGRRKKRINPDGFNNLYQQYQNRKITKKQFAEKLGVSRPTLDKRLKEIEKK